MRDWLARTPETNYNPQTGFPEDVLVGHLPSMDVVRVVQGQITEFEKFIRRFPNDPAWDEESCFNKGDPYGVPTLWVFQAYDIGFVNVVLHVSSTAPDTDFTAKLSNVDPEGRAYNVGDSIQRARWRNGYERPVMMERGGVYELHMGPFFVANRFEAGHRLRLDITSSNFPRYERNLNTGGNNFDEKDGQAARNEVHHGGPYLSRIVLPIVGTGGN